jgi:hypothetical protein
MRSHHGVSGFALALAACGCAASQPAWYPGTPHRHRESAYDWFLVATGTDRGRDRTSSCDAAAMSAWGEISELFLDEAETQGEIVAVAGGPSRVRATLATFLDRVSSDAVRTQELYDDNARRCYVELRWRLPRHLATSVARTLEIRDTEESVGQEIKRALAPEEAPVAQHAAAAPTPEAVIAATYRGWFVRLVTVRDCETHRLAFVGAPGGSEARWLELKQADNGWILVDDRQIGDEGWPSPPELSLCD